MKVQMLCGAIVELHDIFLAGSNPNIKFSGMILNGKPLITPTSGAERENAIRQKLSARARIAIEKLKSPPRKP